MSSPSYPTDPHSGVAPLPPGISAGAIVSGAASPGPAGADACYGDELITFSPEDPRIGNEFLIAVTSSHPHPYGRLAGTEPTRFVRERPGQRGYVWEWTVQPSYPGLHEYTFYVDSTVPCQKIQIRVLQSLATATPKPSKTPTPYGWDNGNENSNGNGNDNFDNTANVYPTYPTYGAYAPVIDPSFYVMPGHDLYNCSAFESQSNAQRVLRYDPSDPNNLDIEPDGHVDGIACSAWIVPAVPGRPRHDAGHANRTDANRDRDADAPADPDPDAHPDADAHVGGVQPGQLFEPGGSVRLPGLRVACERAGRAASRPDGSEPPRRQPTRRSRLRRHRSGSGRRAWRVHAGPVRRQPRPPAIARGITPGQE